MTPANGIKVLRRGAVTIIGFGREAFLGEPLVAPLLDELNSIISQQHPKVIQLDLTGVALLTSEILGVWVSAHNRGVEIVLFNPSEDIRYILEITKLDSLFAVVEADE